MNSKQIKDIIVKFIKNKVAEIGCDRVVIGLSGGIDSSVVATLAVEALGIDRVMGVLMPTSSYHKDADYKDAEDLARSLGIIYTSQPIDKFISDKVLYRIEQQTGDGKLSNIRKGNICARTRMMILYDTAMVNNAIVLGTTNKTELMLGYYTKYGDGGVDIEPIADIYKTEVFALAKYLNLSNNIIEKAPSAGLWEGQTDEDELGMTYENIDKILWCIIEMNYDPTRFAKEMFKLTGIKDRKILDKVLSIMSKNRHKRYMPESVTVGNLDARKMNFKNE